MIRSSAHTRLSSGQDNQRGHHQRIEKKQSSRVLHVGCTLEPGVGVKAVARSSVSAIKEKVRYCLHVHVHWHVYLHMHIH